VNVRILDRYLAKEILLPFFAGLLFLTQILVAIQLLARAEVLFGSGVSLTDILLVALYITPHFLAFVLPVAFLLAAVLGVGRLAEDRELVALGAAGISPTRLVKVPVLMGLAVATLAMGLVVRAEPYGLQAARRKLDAVIKRNISGDVKPGIFYEEIPGFTLYAQEVEGRRWRHVLISDQTDREAPLLVMARAGRIETAPHGGSLQLRLEQGELHREELKASEYVTAMFARSQLTLGLPTRFHRTRDEHTPEELMLQIERFDDEGKVAEGRSWRAFFHRKLANSLSILAFALVAVPIAAARRGGRAFGFTATLFTVAGYHSLMRVAEGMGQRGVIPPSLSPHLPNLACAVIGLALTLWMAHRGAGAVR
jgi:lipopolysaccharide export system permease protein